MLTASTRNRVGLAPRLTSPPEDRCPPPNLLSMFKFSNQFPWAQQTLVWQGQEWVRAQRCLGCSQRDGAGPEAGLAQSKSSILRISISRTSCPEVKWRFSSSDPAISPSRKRAFLFLHRGLPLKVQPRAESADLSFLPLCPAWMPPCLSKKQVSCPQIQLRLALCSPLNSWFLPPFLIPEIHEPSSSEKFWRLLVAILHSSTWQLALSYEY